MVDSREKERKNRTSVLIHAADVAYNCNSSGLCWKVVTLSSLCGASRTSLTLVPVARDNGGNIRVLLKQSI